MIDLEVSPGAQADAASEEQLIDGHLTVPGGLEWDETPVERHTIANLRYAGGKEHDVRYVSEVHLDAALAREAALREELATSREAFKEELDGVKYTRRKFRQELAKFKAGCVDLSSQVRELEHKMDYYKGEGMRADDLQQRLAVAEQRATEMEMDKRRLDFLQENLVSINCRVRNTGFCGPRGREFAAYIYAAGPNDKKPGEGETLRQAIDSMAENNGGALKPAAEGEGS